MCNNLSKQTRALLGALEIHPKDWTMNKYIYKNFKSVLHLTYVICKEVRDIKSLLLKTTARADAYFHLEKCSYLVYIANVIYNILFQRGKVILDFPIC